MDKLLFDSYEDLAVDLIDNANEEHFACAITFYDGARKLLKELSMFDVVTIGDVELLSKEWNGYEREYIVSIDSDFKIDVSPAWRDNCKGYKGGYWDIGNAYILLDGDANSKILKSISDSVCKEYEVDEDEYYEEDNCLCGCDLFDIFEYIMNM